MLSPDMYRKSGLYDFFMKSLGYQSSIDRFLRSLDIDVPAGSRILDAGCGTGLLGLHFAERFNDTVLCATDLEENFLKATLANAEQRGISKERIEVYLSDIGEPRQVRSVDGQARELSDSSFGLVCLGAVIGYSQDVRHSIRELIRLLRPGGTFLNLEMNESPTGRFVSHRYHYHNLSIAEIRGEIEASGCRCVVKKFGWRYLPAKFTRLALIAQKPVS